MTTGSESSRGPDANDPLSEPAAERRQRRPADRRQRPAGSVRGGADYVLAITNAQIHPVTRPDDRARHDRHPRQQDRSGRRERAGAGRRESDRRRRRPTSIRASSTRARRSASDEPGARGFDDVNEMLDFNPQLRTRVAYHSDSDAIPVARANGDHDGGRHAGRRHLRRRGRGDEPRRLDVGRSDAQAERRHHVQLPGHRRRRRARRWRWRRTRRRRRRRRPHLRGHEARARPAARRASARLFDHARAYAEGRARTGRSTGRSKRSCRSSSASCRSSRRVNRAQDIRDAIAFAERAKVNIDHQRRVDASLVAPLLKEKNIPVILGNILSLPQSEDVFHAAPISSPGELAQAGVKFAFSTGDNANVRLAALPRGACRSRGA